MPILLYGLESFQLSNGDLHSLHFTYNRMCTKLFKSSNFDLVKECQSYFQCFLPSLPVKDKYKKLVTKYDNSDNTFCHFYVLQQRSYADARNSYTKSVCPSVRLSLCLSHAGSE